MSESMHRDHDLDLISALAEGRLEDPVTAQELVASCEECAELYRAHRTVREAVAAEISPQMTNSERIRLHNTLWTEVEPSPVATLSRSSNPWWYRLMPVAAVLVVVVGVATVLNSGGESGSEEAMESLASASDDAGGDSATELAPQADSPTEGDEEAETFMAPDTTAAMDLDARTESTEAPATEEASSDFSRAELPAALDEFRDRASTGERTVADDAFECDPPPDVEQLLALESATVDGEEVWFAAYGEADTVGPVVVYRRSDCETILTDE